MSNYTKKQMEYINSVGGQAHMSAVRIIAELEAELAKHEWVSVEEDGSNLPSDPNEEVLWREPSGYMEKYNSEMFVKREVTHYMRIPPIHLPEAKPESEFKEQY